MLNFKKKKKGLTLGPLVGNNLRNIAKSHAPSPFLNKRDAMLHVLDIAVTLELRTSLFWKITTCVIPTLNHTIQLPKIREHDASYNVSNVIM